MSGKKGMQHYSEEFKEIVREEHEKGISQKELSRKYGISRLQYKAGVDCAQRWNCATQPLFPKAVLVKTLELWNGK